MLEKFNCSVVDDRLVVSINECHQGGGVGRIFYFPLFTSFLIKSDLSGGDRCNPIQILRKMRFGGATIRLKTHHNKTWMEYFLSAVMVID